MKPNASQQQNHHTLQLQQYQEQVESELPNKDPPPQTDPPNYEVNTLIAIILINSEPFIQSNYANGSSRTVLRR
ncbi:hypothetical protein CEXT_380551 [Caerostris extrusa]|uniref:Uncharacterized protein n=1 Tax=Caerostris extrusa TaxID=172846 RepID=A0AAV4SIR6_CAEEX|nr:hypothetical protein CEXT_380551 [Caerostris extrusa]